MQIDLPVYFVAQKEYCAVPAEIVDVSPHLAPYTFAVHEGHADWRVSNIETGGAISQSACGERAMAIALARKFLKTISLEKFEAVVAKLPEFVRR